MGEYKQNMLNVSSGYYSEIEQFTLKNKLQPLIQIDGDVTRTLQHIRHKYRLSALVISSIPAVRAELHVPAMYLRDIEKNRPQYLVVYLFA